MTFEKLGDYKRALKAFVRGAIRAKVFVDGEGKLQVSGTKCECDAKTVTVIIANDTYTATFEAEVATRIYNKFNADLFAPIEKQFNKLKNFGGLVVNVEE